MARSFKTKGMAYVKVVLDGAAFDKFSGLNGVSWVPVDPDTTMIKSADGACGHEEEAGTNFTLTLNIDQKSPMNAKITELRKNKGEFDLSVIDLRSNGDIFDGQDCRIANRTGGAKEKGFPQIVYQIDVAYGSEAWTGAERISI